MVKVKGLCLHFAATDFVVVVVVVIVVVQVVAPRFALPAWNRGPFWRKNDTLTYIFTRDWDGDGSDAGALTLMFHFKTWTA